MRTKIEWRSASRENYDDFCRKNPDIKLSFDEWRELIYAYNEAHRDYILETGERGALPFGFGDFAVNKKKRKRTKGVDGKEFINLPVDWKKTKEKGRIIYNFNFHTEGYFFGWVWFKTSSRIKHSDLWFFKPCRATSRMLSHYINVDEKYQHLYKEWKI